MEPTVIDTVLAGALAEQYPSMLSLDLRSNNIIAIHDLRPLYRLRELRLDGNQLTTLDGLGGMQFLTSLSARSNAITHLGDSITSISSLRVLDLAGNHLSAGPWVHLLATMPQLVELDLRGNPVCQLDGSQQLLAAALQGLQRLNGVQLHPAVPPTQTESDIAALQPSDAESAIRQAQLMQQQQQQPSGGAPSIAPHGNSGPAVGRGFDGGSSGDPHMGFAAPSSHPLSGETGGLHGMHYMQTANAQRSQAYAAPTWQHQQQRPHPRAIASSRPADSLPDEHPPSNPQLLRLQLESAGQAHGKLLSDYQALLADRGLLAQQAVLQEDALRKAEEASAQLQQQMQQQSAAAAQQVAGVASQMASMMAERDAAVRHADSLTSQLAEARARAAEAAQAASQLQQQVEELQGGRRQLLQEMRATQDLLLHAQSAASSFSAAADAAAGAAGSGGSPAAPGRRGAASPGAVGLGGAQLQQALQQRVAALQQVVRMQERELVRLGGLSGGQSAGGVDAAGAPHGASADGRWDNVLHPWREQVQALHEQMGCLAAEGAEQRAVWGQQLGEMHEQFTQARTLLEVLEQRSREQRSENAQLQARAAQLGSELQEERQRGASLEQQLAARDAAAQVVRRQVLAFKAHTEQQQTALESRAAQLSAQAARLSYASTRLTFVLHLSAVRGQRGGGGAGGVLPQPAGLQTSLLQRAHGSDSHVALPGLLAASPAAMAAASADALFIGGPSSLPWTPWTPGARGNLRGGAAGNSGPKAAGPEHEDAPLVAVLRQELSKMGRDREMLLQQLAQVSSSAEERIRLAQAAMQEREARHREALLATRVQAAQQAVEAAAERRVQAAEAASAAQATQVRQQVQAAVEAAEDLCRRVEAAAGLRMSRVLVRLQDLAKQVGRLRAAQQHARAELQAVSLDRERLRQELAQSRKSEVDLRRQLTSRGSEVHAELAELRAAHDEALAAERRRTTEAERLSAKAASECGQLERQLARMREVKTQQEDARLRRLQSQVHEQETQLNSLRRERSTLLAVLRKHNVHLAAGDCAKADKAADGAGAAAAEAFSGAARGVAAGNVQGRGADAPRRAGADDTALPLPPRQWSLGHPGLMGLDASSGAGAGSSISSIIRSTAALFHTADEPTRDTSVQRDAVRSQGVRLSRDATSPAGAGVQAHAVGPSAAIAPPSNQPNTVALRRLTELEALTAELLSM